MAQATATKKTAKTAGTGNAPAKAKQTKNAQAIKGAYGAGLATVFIREAEEQAMQELKVEVSYKDRLKELRKADGDSHREFRATMEARRELIGKEAGKHKLSVAKYLDANTVDRTLYNRISMWVRMSKACETGWEPDYDKSWGEISKAASDRLAGQAAAAAQAKLNETIKSIEARTDLKDEDKKALVHVERMKMPVEAAGPTQHQSARGRKRQDKPVFDSVLELIKDRPISEVEKLAQQIIFYIATKMGNKSVKLIADGLVEDMLKSKPAPATTTATGKGNAPTGETKKEHATASGERNPMHSRKAKRR